MSNRASFTTQYFYNDDDYKIVREALSKDNGKYCCVAPEASWSWGEYEYTMPIVQGKVGGLGYHDEYDEIVKRLYDVKTKERVRVVVICDDPYYSITVIDKSPMGSVDWNTFDDSDLERGWEE